uniref:Uncharacterized protein n=1 Tax=Octopus bimaculoides TaxID=37653 RepID=A0A0L8HIX1_OCTBM
MEKTFDRRPLPSPLIWWSMRKLGIDEWLVRAIQAMYKDAVILQAVTEEFKIEYHWELLYADDLPLITESLPELEKKLSEGGVRDVSSNCSRTV